MSATAQPNGIDATKIGTWIILAILACVILLAHNWAYLRGPVTHNLSDLQRTAVIKSALKKGTLVAMRESGMGTIDQTEIARIGHSNCTGEQQCVRWRNSRRSPERCTAVEAVMSCAYELVDRSGATAVALIQTTRSEYHKIPELSRDDPEWVFELLLTVRPDQKEANAKLCEMGYCATGALNRWKPAARSTPPDADVRHK